MANLVTKIGAAVLASIPLVIGCQDTKKNIPVINQKIESKVNVDKLPFCFFWQGDLVDNTIKLELSTFNEARLEKGLKKQGIVNPQEVKDAIEYINNKVKEFNGFISTKTITVLEPGPDKTNTEVLKPKVSPEEALNKYSLAKYGYPIKINVNSDKTVSAVSIREYLDPKDNTVKPGIYFEILSTDKLGKNKIEETFLVPNYANFAIVRNQNIFLTSHATPLAFPDDN